MARPARALSASLVLTLATACGSSGGSPGSGPGSGTPKSTPATRIDFASFFPPDLFTGAPAPLELTVTPAASGGFSGVVGPDGGTVNATGPDGTTYVLEIPPGALKIATGITATPIQDVTGFPFDAPLAHRAGVVFTPSGLQFAKSATLTISPPGLSGNEGVAALSYLGAGHDAAGEVATVHPGAVSLSVDHFSGYVLTWPMELPEWRRLAQIRLENREREITQIMSAWVGAQRQLQLSGADVSNQPSLGEFAKSWVPQWQEEVLIPRLNAAGLGCQEGQVALQYWFGYWAQLQKMGVPEDPDFAVKFNGSTYTGPFDLPEQLLPTFFGHCMDELYQRCVETGDFFAITLFMLGIERQWELIGATVDPSLFDAAVAVSKKCGHWQLKMDASFSVTVPDATASAQATSTMDLEWKPGAGAGILQFIEAKIEKVEGTGDITVSNFDVQFANEPGSGCTMTKHSPVQTRTTAARLKALDWEYPDEPGTPDWAMSGYPTRLVMVLDPGAVDTTITLSCPPGTMDLPIDVYQPEVLLVINGFGSDPDGTETEHLLDHGWTFPSIHPFQAELDAPSNLAVSGDLKLTLHHTPQ